MEEGNIRKILCYGDSNTYGYDPRDLMGMRYPVDSIWTELTQKALGERWLVMNRGLNGRMLPDSEAERFQIRGLMEDLGSTDFLVIMLGTNDILLTQDPNAEAAIRRMERLLSFLHDGKETPECRIITVAPPLIGKGLDPDGAYFTESLKMNIAFLVLAEKYGVTALDAGSWGIPLAYDHVHFSLEGHRVFAEKFTQAIREVIGDGSR